MNKLLLSTFICFVLLNLFCNDPFDSSNPLDSQSSIKLQAPKNLQADSITETVVGLRFEDTNTVTEPPWLILEYEIEQSSDGSNYIKMSNAQFHGTHVTISGTFLSTKTYYYRIRAKDANTISDYSNVVIANLSFPAPSNLAVDISNETKATLSWTNTNSLATTIVIEKSNNGVNYFAVDSIAATAKTKDVAGVYSCDTAYYFRIVYKSTLNQSAYTGPASQKLGFPAPSNLAVTFTSDVNAKLTWTNTSSLAKTEIIEKSTNGTNYVVVDSVAAFATSKDLTGVYKNDTTYYFRIKSRSIANQSAYTSPVSRKLGFAAPSNFTFTFTSDVNAKLTWTNTNTLATAVIIEKSNDGTNYTIVDSTAATTTIKDVAGVYSSDTSYSFRIKYKSSINQSAYTVPSSQKLSFATPLNLQVTAITETAVTFRWQNINSMATRIVIEQSPYSTSKFAVLDSVDASTSITSRTIGGNFSKDTTYYFRLQAKSNINKSYYSTVASGHISSTREKIHQVYCLGNSITNNGTYEYQLNTLLGTEWYVNNEGVNGNNTAQMYARLNKDILDLGDAEYVVVMGGVNDVAQNIHADQIETNLQSIYTAIHNVSVKVVAVTITPFKGRTQWNVAAQASLDSVNTWILNTANHVDYRVNVYTVLEDPNNPDQLLPEYNGDWVHLSGTGYLVLGTTIYNGATWTK